MRRYVLRLGCVGLFLVAGCGPMHIHLGGRYDCRTGAVHKQQGSDLVQQLFDEAARERESNGTFED